MKTTPRLQDALFDAALSLSNEERVELADRLWMTADDSPIPPEVLQEVERRIADLKAGKLSTISAEELMARLRARVNS